MANFTTALLGSFSRIFFPPASSSSHAASSDLSYGFTSSQSDPDVPGAYAHNHLRPASAHVRPRPSSATIEGYWSWEGGRRILRREAGNHRQRDLGLKGLAEVQLTRPSPVVACQPLSTRSRTSPLAHTVPEELDIADASDRTADDSFSFDIDISLISDTSTSTTSSEEHDADDEDDGDASFAFLSPPRLISSTHPYADARHTLADSNAHNLGLGLGFVKPDGSPFDGLGVLSFGCSGVPRTRTRNNQHDKAELSRTFLEEAAWTWAADPHHRMLSVIHEDEEEDEAEELPLVGVASTSSTSTPRQRKTSKNARRDLSMVDTISSGLKRRQALASDCAPGPRRQVQVQGGINARPRTPAPFSAGVRSPSTIPTRTPSASPVPGPRSPSVASSARRSQPISAPVWRA
ncbi:hypothetical protein B0H16DRAFT_1620862 [Mycena metata]|uniref:Uncharacterized protein n=1 Tax=Mycena metata TaxID=1033252 RepID=A0AAD7H717_9AGAR|nr:hypothetical protein B0H16DRAFT_1620862 [Mycena metata]